jgi:hypothetical protein
MSVHREVWLAERVAEHQACGFAADPRQGDELF